MDFFQRELSLSKEVPVSRTLVISSHNIWKRDGLLKYESIYYKKYKRLLKKVDIEFGTLNTIMKAINRTTIIRRISWHF